MGILLRITLIILLILSIAALLVGLNLFQQREELKGRLQLAESTLSDVARTIEAEEADDLAQRDLPLMQLDRDQLRTFYQLDETGKPLRDEQGNRIASGSGTMAELLADLRGRAAVQYNRLNDTRDTLSQTRLELAATRKELEDTKVKLAQTEAELEQTRTELAAARNTIREQEEQIAQLNRDKERLETQITEQRLRIDEMNDEIADLRMRTEQDAQMIADLRRRLDDFERTPGEDDAARASRDVSKGHKGQVLLVNKDWNFVILDLAEDDRAIHPALVLMVQRDDRLVGKVRVSEIKGDNDRRLAVADIMVDWLQMPIREGDHVFF